jgi:N-acetylglutamate synthase-like GNAT family acetyltransferase
MSQKRLIFVAIKDNRIVGTVSLKDNFILTLFVDSTKLHQGIGTLLMKHVELHARQQGHLSVKVLSRVTAYPFYQQLGYQTTDLRESEIWKRHRNGKTNDSYINICARRRIPFLRHETVITFL